MKRWLRVLRHRWFDDRDARRMLDDAALDRLAERVRRSELGHGGEIRICIEGALPLPLVWRGTSVRERAIMMFGQLRVWDTEANNGVLIYLLRAERAIEIVCDRGVARVVRQGQWDAIAARLGEALRAGRVEEGLAEAVDSVGELLRAHLISAPGAVGNELPDRPVQR
ncbi:MAG TPA: TPM domain-containing protein [Rubrivivax sp.]|nr:TPM domain-containing protein [Burkholderiales bacterium]HNU12100.1 TPM domain-containing protein [Rubrivivax sp.]